MTKGLTFTPVVWCKRS